MSHFKEAIGNMAASSLRCVAIAYRPYEVEKVPTEEEIDQWEMPEGDLILLAIVGIKVLRKTLLHLFYMFGRLFLFYVPRETFLRYTDGKCYGTQVIELFWSSV